MTKLSNLGIWNLAREIATPRQVGARNDIKRDGGEGLFWAYNTKYN
jgi:hypothetical protein